MKYSENCEHCGHKLTAYTSNLNRPLVSALRQLVDAYEELRRPINLQKDLNLTKNQYNNFQKLQYFWLVKRIESGWLPTPVGISFIHNEQGVLNPAGNIGDEILASDHPAWKTTKKRKMVYVTDIDSISYKKRKEYQQEKSLQERLI